MTRLKKPFGYRPILGIDSNAKTKKGNPLGYMTAILYLAPHKLSGWNVCASAKNCPGPCLNLSGRGAMAKIQATRLAKTVMLFTQRALFLECLRYDIRALINKAARKGMKPAVRINGTSDLPWLSLMMASEFPGVQFYDYTKHARSWERVRPNYHLTFSHDGEHNRAECLRALRNGINVAVVFTTPKGQELPATWHGYRVIDGDMHDLRFKDEAGVIVGLRAKGPAIGHKSEFIQIGLAA